MSLQNQLKRDTEKDIELINITIKNKVPEEILKIHKYIDGKYQSKINMWGYSMYNWMDGIGFDYSFISDEALIENLETMLSKIEGYKQDIDMIVYEKYNGRSKLNIYNTNNNVNVNKNEISFEVIEKNIQENESLTEEQTKEIIEKLYELKKIYNSSDNKKTKWNKAKKILVWIADKSVDIGIAFLPILTSMFTK